MGAKEVRRKIESLAQKKERMVEVISRLRKAYPESKCSLEFKTPFQLLVATILSAQCTDERVNKVTPALFERFPDSRAMSMASLPEIEKLVQSTGFYKNKAKSLLEMSAAVQDRFGGEVPREMEDLTTLRGVGRKTANVVRGVAFGVPGFVVDTHIGRICRRLGFTKSTDAVKVEFEMMEIAPRQDWTHLGHLFISHGRAICASRKPDCLHCPLLDLCPRVGVKV